MIKSIFFSLVIMIFFLACDDNMDSLKYDCSTKIGLTEYVNTEDRCREAQFDSVAKIEENLIGQWQLVGIKSGWVDTLFYECLAVDISEDELTIRNEETGEETTSDWEIETWQVNVSTGFYLKTNEDVWNNRIGMETFSETFMYGTGRVDDGSSYLYEKIE